MNGGSGTALKKTLNPELNKCKIFSTGSQCSAAAGIEEL